jgi:large subunit ribosomal protein L7/L12
MTAESLVKEIEGMTVLELNTLVKALEEKFGVSAAAMAMPVAAAGGAAAGAAAPAEEEKTEFTVHLAAGRQDQDDQGRPRGHEPGPEGGQGPRRRRAGRPEGRRLEGRGRRIKKKFEEVGAKVEIK